MKPIKIMDKTTKNTVIINKEFISSIEINAITEKMDCDEDGFQDMDILSWLWLTRLMG